MNIQNVRQEFPALEQQVFLDSACVSLPPQRTVQRLRAFLDMAALCPSGSSAQHILDMDAMRGAARPQIAKLINADEHDIALVESTTHGLNLVANAISLQRGDRVVISDLEFLELALPWLQKREQVGIAIDVLPNRGGVLLVEDVEAAITRDTRVVAVSSVQWNNGFRCDLDALSRLCRERGVFLIVDAIQQIGAVPLDVQKTPVDALACGGHKWLLSPFGCGFLYLGKEFRAQVKAPLAGYLSVAEPEDGWGTYFGTPSISPMGDFEYVDSARRWENGGTSNYPGAIGLAESVGLLNEIGIDNIGQYVLSLTDHLIAALHEAKIKVVTPEERRYRSGIVTFSLNSPAENAALIDFLRQRNVLVSLRYSSDVGGVRVGCHLFNSPTDLDQLVEHATALARQPGRRRA